MANTLVNRLCILEEVDMQINFMFAILIYISKSYRATEGYSVAWGFPGQPTNIQEARKNLVFQGPPSSKLPPQPQ